MLCSAGAALSSMLEFFQALVAANLPGLGYRDLLQLLMAPITVNSSSPTVANTPTLHKQVNTIRILSSNLKKSFRCLTFYSSLIFQAFHSLAKCVAALTVTWKPEAILVVEQFLADVNSQRSDSQHIFALLVIAIPSSI